MTDHKFKKAATELLKRRVPGTKLGRLDVAIRPNSSEDALQIQQQMISIHSHQVGGWKCLRPISKEQLVVAPIFADTIQQGKQCFLFADKGVALVEPEIAFILGKDLPAQQEDYSDTQIDEAIASCHMALELIQRRYAENIDISFNEELADGLMNQGLFIGPKINRAVAYNASNINISFKQQKQTQHFAAKHPNTLAQNPVYWLINFMSKRGTNFKAGQAIITGSYAGVVKVEFEQMIEIEYQNIGQYTLEFKAVT